MKYECDSRTHVYLNNSQECVCKRGPRLNAKGKASFKGTVGELEKLRNDSVRVEENVM